MSEGAVVPHAPRPGHLPLHAVSLATWGKVSCKRVNLAFLFLLRGPQGAKPGESVGPAYVLELCPRSVGRLTGENLMSHQRFL